MNGDDSPARIPSAVAFDDAPLTRFHVRLTAASTGGVFSDGFGLGIIGTALGAATDALHLTPLWIGLLGGASLAGLFVGALLTGPLADRIGRRRIFAVNMAVLGALSLMQFFVTSAAQLLVLRLCIGILLGTDYVVSKAMLTEWTPRRTRGAVMSLLSVAWAGGFAAAFATGVALADGTAQSWRLMLLSAAVPSLAVWPLRLGIPESPLWLAARGLEARAHEAVRSRFGPGVTLPPIAESTAQVSGRWRQLLSPRWRRRTLVACAFFTCQVIPYFAIGTFVSQVLSALNVRGGHAAGLVYNASLLLGAAVGVVIVDRIPRRSFLIGSFALAAAAMSLLTAVPTLPASVMIGLFALFAVVLSGASNLVYVYLPELFPTDLRASGIGLAVAASRLGSAIGTFLLPILVAAFGVHSALTVCVAVLLSGGIVCYAWAPETQRTGLGVIDGAVDGAP